MDKDVALTLLYSLNFNYFLTLVENDFEKKKIINILIKKKLIIQNIKSNFTYKNYPYYRYFLEHLKEWILFESDYVTIGILLKTIGSGNNLKDYIGKNIYSLVSYKNIILKNNNNDVVDYDKLKFKVISIDKVINILQNKNIIIPNFSNDDNVDYDLIIKKKIFNIKIANDFKHTISNNDDDINVIIVKNFFKLFHNNIDFKCYICYYKSENYYFIINNQKYIVIILNNIKLKIILYFILKI